MLQKKFLWKKLFVFGMALFFLMGCAETSPPPRQMHGRQTPAQPPLPDYPVGSFDQQRSDDLVILAQEKRKAGDFQEARDIALQAVDYWPSSPGAWLELRMDYQALHDESGEVYASFFLAKVDYAASLPPRAASLGFETITSNKLGSRTGDYIYDERGLAMARRLWAFYGADDPLKGGEAVPADQETFMERYPYVSAAGIIGAGAGMIMFIKDAANR